MTADTYNLTFAAAVPVFNGAEGFGIYTDVWARPTKIVRTELETGITSLPFIAALPGPKRIVFDSSVSTINLKNRLKITEPYTTIEGPVTITGRGIEVNTHDVLLRHLRIRPGRGDPTPDSARCVSIFDTANGNFTLPEDSVVYNVVVDSCSLYWATDQILGVNGCRDVTISNCIIAECLMDATSAHSFALLAYDVHNFTFIKNVIAHCQNRLPTLEWNTKAVVGNNIIYNPYDEIMEFASNQSDGNSQPIGGLVTFDGNVVRLGPNSQSPDPRDPTTGRTTYLAWIKEALSDTRIYGDDNMDWEGALVDGDFNLDAQSQSQPNLEPGSPPISAPNTTMLSSTLTKLAVPTVVGAKPLDSHDLRILDDLDSGTGGYISDPSEVGG